MTDRRKSQRGVTLLEVMISMAIFAIGLLGLARMHTVAASSNNYARRLDRASTLAQELMSYLQEVPYGSGLLATPNTTNDAAGFDFLDEGGALELTATADVGTLVDFDADNNLGGGASLPDAADASATNPCTAPATCLFRGHQRPGLPAATRPTIDFNQDGLADFERYWSTRPHQVNGENAGVQIAVIVRWREPGSGLFRRVVVYGHRFDPSMLLPQ